MSKKMTIDAKIEEDGTVTITTGDLSGEYHKTADEFLKFLAELMGGPVEARPIKGAAKLHSHGHGHSHSHEDGEHHHHH